MALKNDLIEAARTEAASVLHYDPEWFEYNLVSLELLQNQVSRYRASEDKNSEHYRCAAFREILASHSALSDAQMTQYLELARIDEDTVMAQSALCDLIQWTGLTQEQFDRLSEHPVFAAPLFQKLITRRRIIRELQNAPVSSAIFAQCLASRDSIVQNYLLANGTLTREQLQSLAEHGINRAIRNRASAKLRGSENADQRNA